MLQSLRHSLVRIAHLLSIMLGVVTGVFLLFNVLPGDPVEHMLSQRASAEEIKTLRKDLHLDLALPWQYLSYLNDLSPLSMLVPAHPEHPFYLDKENKYTGAKELVGFENWALVLNPPYLRRSYVYQQKVVVILKEAMVGTAILAMIAIIIASVLGIALGVVSAIAHNTMIDKFINVVSILGMSLPSFFTAVLVAWFFAFKMGHITGLNVSGSLFGVDEFDGVTLQPRNLILPALTLSIRPLAMFTQLVRDSMLEVLSMDYVRTAHAKGLSAPMVIVRHALRNGLTPVLTSLSGWFASMLAGAVFVEIVFGYKGLGLVILNALNDHDMPLLMGGILLISTIFALINFSMDSIYRVLDPRVGNH